MFGSGLNINAGTFNNNNNNANVAQPTTSATGSKTRNQAGSSGNTGLITLADGSTMQVAKFNGKSNANDLTKLQTP